MKKMKYYQKGQLKKNCYVFLTNKEGQQIILLSLLIVKKWLNIFVLTVVPCQTS